MFPDKEDIPTNMSITTSKKIRGLLQSVLNEDALGHIPETFNFETLMKAKGTSLPKKIQV